MKNNLDAAFRDAEVIAERMTAEEAGRVVRLPKVSSVPIAREEGELHCFDPWFVARVVSGSHRRAKTSLSREGFEVFYPAGRVLRPLPKRYIPPKKRRSRQLYLQEDVRLPYSDYIFLRYMFGEYPLSRLFDLDGVAGICMSGETFSTVQDYEVETLRLMEFDGVFDRCEVPAVSAKQLMLAHIRKTEAAIERWNDRTVTVAILDESRRTIHFVEEFGRITRVITS